MTSLPSPDTTTAPRQVVVLAGPSGAGKSRLAARLSARHGWPTVRLDDFYRDGDDPALPMLPIGLPDWDHPGSWHTEAAVTALEHLSAHGQVDVPTYDISTSRAQGRTTVTADHADVVLAEGIFAAEIVPHLQSRGLGITNLVPRATAGAAELTPAELREGRERLRKLVRTRSPRVVAVAGITAYRHAFGEPKAQPGRQDEPFEGSELWVVPNPSGLNAHENVASLADAYAAPARAARVL